MGGGAVIEAEDAANERDCEALRTKVRGLTEWVIGLEFEHMDLERRLAASEAEVARLERLHREQTLRQSPGPAAAAKRRRREK